MSEPDPNLARQRRLATKRPTTPMELDLAGEAERRRYRIGTPKALPQLGWYDRLKAWWQRGWDRS